MAFAYVQSVTYRDIKGQTASIRFFVPTTRTFDNIKELVNATKPLTNANAETAKGIFQGGTTAVQYGEEGDYENVEDKATFVFTTDSGDLLRISIPAPKVTVFLDDEETINAAETNVAAFITKVIANVCNRDAFNVTKYVGGYRKRTKRRKQNTIYTRNPQLTTQG